MRSWTENLEQTSKHMVDWQSKSPHSFASIRMIRGLFEFLTSCFPRITRMNANQYQNPNGKFQINRYPASSTHSIATASTNCCLWARGIEADFTGRREGTKRSSYKVIANERLGMRPPRRSLELEEFLARRSSKAFDGSPLSDVGQGLQNTQGAPFVPRHSYNSIRNRETLSKWHQRRMCPTEIEVAWTNAHATVSPI